MRPTPLKIRRPHLPQGRQRTIEAPIERYEPPLILKVTTEAERKAAREAERVIRRQNTPPPKNPPTPPPGRHNYRPKKIQELQYDGSVPKLYPGRDAILMATGPSLTQEVIEQIRPYHEAGAVLAFGCNDSYSICDYLDVHYACDPPWWDLHVHYRDIADHPAVKWTQDKNVPRKYGINWIPGTSGNGLSTKHNCIHFGGNSGYQLINLALLYGIRKMILVGYNMGVPPGKKQHFFGSHPQPLSRSTSFASFVAAYNTIQPLHKSNIINCTPESNLTAFERRPLIEVLEECRQFQKVSPVNPPSSLEPAPP